MSFIEEMQREAEAMGFETRLIPEYDRLEFWIDNSGMRSGGSVLGRTTAELGSRWWLGHLELVRRNAGLDDIERAS